MAVQIKLKSGIQGSAPTSALSTLTYAEPGYDSANKKLYIGDTVAMEICNKGGDTSYLKNADIGTTALSTFNDDLTYLSSLPANALVDAAFGTAGFMKTNGSGTYSVAGTLGAGDLTGTPGNGTSGYLLTSNQAGGFTWTNPATVAGVDEDVNIANLTARLAQVTGSIVVGAAGSNVTITGDLNVTGTVNTVSTTNLLVEDHKIFVAKGQGSESLATGAGLEVDCGSDTNASLIWNSSGTIGGGTGRHWVLSDHLQIAPASGIARFELKGTGDSQLVMTDGATSTAVITGSSWTGTAIADAQIASAATWNTAAANVGQWNGGAITGGTAQDGRNALGLQAGAMANFGTGSTDMMPGNTTFSFDDITGSFDGGTW